MDDLSQQLNQILSDPQSMQQIQGIMSSLGLGGNGENPGGQAGSNSVPPAQTSPSPQPVSYTHLDVYKRQEAKIFGGDEKNCFNASSTMQRCEGAAILVRAFA